MNIIQYFKEGAIGVMLTDTVYGLVAKASDKQAVAKLYALKNREHKPGTVIAYDVKQLREMGIKSRHLVLPGNYWPNPLSVMVPVTNDLNYLALGKGSLAVRIPKDPRVLDLLRLSGPVLTTSANQSGQPFARNIKEAKKYFGSRVDFYIDDGDSLNHQPSTIIKITNDRIEILRDGEYKFKL